MPTNEATTHNDRLSPQILFDRRTSLRSMADHLHRLAIELRVLSNSPERLQLTYINAVIQTKHDFEAAIQDLRHNLRDPARPIT